MFTAPVALPEENSEGDLTSTKKALAGIATVGLKNSRYMTKAKTAKAAKLEKIFMPKKLCA